MFTRTAAASENIDAPFRSVIRESLDLLQSELVQYFPDICVKEYDWIRNPFVVSMIDVQGLQLTEEEEMCTLKTDRTLHLQFPELTLNKFWLFVLRNIRQYRRRLSPYCYRLPHPTCASRDFLYLRI